MVECLRRSKETQTDVVRPRRTWYGSVVMQVQMMRENYRPGDWDGPPASVEYYWRDALPNDDLFIKYKGMIHETTS